MSDVCGAEWPAADSSRPAADARLTASSLALHKHNTQASDAQPQDSIVNIVIATKIKRESGLRRCSRRASGECGESNWRSDNPSLDRLQLYTSTVHEHEASRARARPAVELRHIFSRVTKQLSLKEAGITYVHHFMKEKYSHSYFCPILACNVRYMLIF